MPLLVVFGGRVRIFSFFTEPSFPLNAPLSFFVAIFLFFSFNRVHALGERKREKLLQIKREGNIQGIGGLCKKTINSHSLKHKSRLGVAYYFKMFELSPSSNIKEGVEL